MNLEKTTFGKTPAAMYLAQYLNETGKLGLARKVSRVISAWRATLNDLVCCHLQTDELSVRSFNRLLSLYDTGARAAAQKIPDKLAAELVTNMLVGELKNWKTRSGQTAVLQRQLQHQASKAGTEAPTLKVTPRRGEETYEERVARLQQKSRDYLARKGKVNTLY